MLHAKRLTRVVLTLLLLLPVAARAQDFGVMESAETINQGNFKLRVNPLLFFGKGGGDNRAGIAALVGYGFTPHMDVEGGVSLGDGVQIFGANAEFNVVSNRSMNFSIIPGVHVRRGDQELASTGIDLVLLASRHATKRLDIYGALDMAFEQVTDDRMQDANYNTFHVVPGLEYKLHQDLELLVEVGLGLNDSSSHYLSGGIAYYFR